MKNAWISGGILALIFIFVGINSHVLDKMIVELEERVCAWESGDEEEFKKIYEEYVARSWYINLSVSHNLTS